MNSAFLHTQCTPFLTLKYWSNRSVVVGSFSSRDLSSTNSFIQASQSSHAAYVLPIVLPNLVVHLSGIIQLLCFCYLRCDSDP